MSDSVRRKSVLYLCPSCGAWPYTWRPSCEVCFEANARAPDGVIAVSLRARDDDGEEIMWVGGDSIIGAEEERPEPDSIDALLLPDDEAEDLYLDRYDDLHGDKF